MARLRQLESKRTDLSSLAHQQTMELLRLGDKSTKPGIAEAAAEIARERERAFHAVARRAPTRAAVVLISTVAIVALGLCWYVLLFYPRELANRLIEIILGIAVVVIALYLLIYGHLTQDNFMKIMEWIKDLFRRRQPSDRHASQSSLPLGEDITIKAQSDGKNATD